MAYATPQAVAPTAASHSVVDVNQLDVMVPGMLDLMAIGEEDVTRNLLGLPPRFAVPQRVSITPAKCGTVGARR